MPFTDDYILGVNLVGRMGEFGVQAGDIGFGLALIPGHAVHMVRTALQ